MPGPMAKPPGTRQRRNRHSTNALLAKPAEGEVQIPKLVWPKNRPLHPLTKRWWEDIWASPMAPEYDDSDIHGLYQLAMLVNDFWMAEKPHERRAVSAEIRMAGQRFGISPMDRRRLQWEIAKTEEAVDRGRKRKAREDAGSAGEPAPTPAPGFDPRRALRSV